MTLGTNRWIWDGSNWVTKSPKGTGPSKSYTISDTLGCSCKQILDLESAATGLDFSGHYKHGCSSSVLDNFILDASDGTVDGKLHKEYVTVPASQDTPTLSSMTLDSTKTYLLKASGTAWACSQPGCNIEFDADYAINHDGTQGWINGVEDYLGYGPDLLDLKVNNGFVDWDTDTTYNADHTYWYTLAGTGSPLSLLIHDVYYPNNSGNLLVDIFVKLW